MTHRQGRVYVIGETQTVAVACPRPHHPRSVIVDTVESVTRIAEAVTDLHGTLYYHLDRHRPVDAQPTELGVQRAFEL
ncbi:hypothetical protein [Halobaculum rubrum]|uniref:hypothetical protein n=1 Tax=Halobaculum rubrum TaxID=2872158 RepID=UPI001CA40F38|nr:hypothetical protein [Halobaculum rubrum]QZY01174.1 hypothetical protein K6T25_15405 [Halobaculum rubrum]